MEYMKPSRAATDRIVRCSGRSERTSFAFSRRALLSGYDILIDARTLSCAVEEQAYMSLTLAATVVGGGCAGGTSARDSGVAKISVRLCAVSISILLPCDLVACVRQSRRAVSFAFAICDEILPCWNVNVFAALVLATEIATVALDARCVAFTVRAAGFTAVVLEKAAARAGHSGSCTGRLAAFVLATEIATVALDARCVAFTVLPAGFTAVVLEKAAARAGHSGSCTGHAAAGLGGTPSVISQAVVHVI